MARHETGAQDARDEGATAVEYSLLVAGIVGILVVLVFAIGGYTRGDYKQACDNFSAASMSSATGNSC
jgi:Flp pilus assembly pilin Flp